ncbi:MAG: hypothetical protein JNM93_02965, partial [Bacteriovoracaceae bacterium]|nr:hypothetical protein [Bacteriovoracaceae bacterium]
ISHKLKKKVSAADIANTYFERIAGDIQHNFKISESEFLEDIPAYGSILFNAVMDRGVCLEKDLPTVNMDIRSIMTEAEKLVGEVQAQGTKFDMEKYACSPPASWENSFPHLSQYDYLRTVIRSRKDNVYDNLVEQNCKSVREEVPYSFRKKIYLNNNEFFDDQKNIDKALESGEIILAAVNVSRIFEDDVPRPRKLYPTHYLTIVGRQFNDTANRCEYILRNSWGEGCTNYPHHKCDKGHIWVPEADLSRHLYETIYLE